MNRNLLLFAVFLILLGAGFNFYLLSFFGLLMLIPAFLSSSRPPMRPAPAPAKQEVRRIAPPPVSQPEVALAQTQPRSTTAVPTATQPQTYAPPLFPTPMFPSNIQLGTSQTVGDAATAKPAERDELLEVGAILVLLRLAFG